VHATGHDRDGLEDGDAMIRNRHRAKGQAMVEFALIIPIFLLILFGIVDLSRYVYSTNALSEVSREAARQGTVGLRPAECNGLTRVVCIQTLAKNRLTAVTIVLSDVQVVCQRLNSAGALPVLKDTDNCGTSWRANDLVRVKITRNLGLVTPLIGQLIGAAVMSGEAQVTVSG
jgi:Flp pilus assembly protein TadG